MAYRTPVDIAGRALQSIGMNRIYSFTDMAPGAAECGAIYDDMRLAELGRHAWAFSLRRARLRPISFTTQLWTPPTYAAATAYTVGQVVNYAATAYTPNTAAVTYPWQLGVPTATGSTPDTSSDWGHFFGSLCVDVFDSGLNYAASELTLVPPTYAGGTTYAAGNMVKGSDDLFYVSLVNSNVGHTPQSSATYWEPWVEPSTGDPLPDSILYTTGVSFKTAPTIYISIVNHNGPARQDPTLLPSNYPLAWTSVGGTVAKLTPLFPNESSWCNERGSNNLYRLPAGFIRDVPEEAKWTKHPWLGAVLGQMPRDISYFDQYFTTSHWAPFDFPFVADVADVTLMPSQFCESVGLRMGLDLDPILKEGKQDNKLTRAYKRVVGEAMRSDMIMQGDPAPEIEELILVRQ